MKNSSHQSQDDLFVLKLRKSIINNLSNDQFGVEYLSAEVGLSRSQLYRRLKILKNQTISQFIRQVRLEEAMKLLQNNVASVTDIAFLTGFNSPSYFHKCFLEHFGYTPGEARKMAREQEADEALRNFPGPGSRKQKRSEKRISLSISRGGLRKRWVSVLVFLIGLVASGLYVFQNFHPNTAVANAVAVLPLECLSEAPRQHFLAKELQEAIITELGQVNGLRLISKTSARRFTENNLLLPEIAEKLGVEAIVEGALFISGSNIKLRLQLIGTMPEEQQIWAKEYHSQLDQFATLQEILIRDISRQVKNRIGQTTKTGPG